MNNQKSKLEMLGNILENLFDIIIKMVQIGFVMMMDIVKNLSWMWSGGNDTIPTREEDTDGQEVVMWNGGGRGKSDDSPSDNIIYDGIMGEYKNDNG